MFADEDPVAFNEQVETLTRALEASADAGARRSARELVRLILEFHGLGLRRVLGIIDAGPSSLRQRMAEDPVIAGLLTLHGLESLSCGPDSAREQRIGDAPLIQISRRAVPLPTPSIAAHHD